MGAIVAATQCEGMILIHEKMFESRLFFVDKLIGMGANLLLLMPFGRGDESEADILGLDYMARAGFDPREAVDLWVNMARAGGGSQPEFLSTHPSHETRIRDIQRRLPQVMPLYEQARASGQRPNCRP